MKLWAITDSTILITRGTLLPIKFAGTSVDLSQALNIQETQKEAVKDASIKLVPNIPELPSFLDKKVQKYGDVKDITIMVKDV